MNTNRIIKGYCEQLYVYKFDKLNEMDRFLDSCQNSHKKDRQYGVTCIKEVE